MLNNFEQLLLAIFYKFTLFSNKCWFFPLFIAGHGQMYGRGGATYGGQTSPRDQSSAVTPPQPQSAPYGRGMYLSRTFILFKQVTTCGSFCDEYYR